MKKTGIYKITHIPSGKFYIGQSTDIENRWQHHKTQQFFIPSEELKFEILELCEKQQLNDRERSYIIALKDIPLMVNTMKYIEDKDHINARRREYRKQNPEKFKRYYYQNREKFRAKALKYYYDNYDKNKADQLARYYLKKAQLTKDGIARAKMTKQEFDWTQC
jgi:hypothetical protein